MKTELEEIVEKHLEGNYLMGAMSKKLMVDELYEFTNQDKVREAAERVLKIYRNSLTEEPIIEALQELEKALNQKQIG